MKKYTTPDVEVIEIDANDVIATSLGTETGRYDETDGIWDLDIATQ
jgi:hypothetical protein